MKPRSLALTLLIAAAPPAIAQEPHHPRVEPPPEHHADRSGFHLVPHLEAQAPSQAHADDPLGRHLFPPELVMSNQRAISLQDAQRETIMQSVRYSQAVLGEMQMRMAGEMERLAELLQAPAVDSTAALGQLDRVLMHEHQIKRAHIAMLIRIRNTLTAEQRIRLDAIRSAHRGGSPPRD